jgi:hypothetical protein
MMKACKAAAGDAGSAAVKGSKGLSHDSDITDMIDAIRSTGKLKAEQVMMCDVVVKGRHYMFHGTDTRRSLALLQCTCAVASLLRFRQQRFFQSQSAKQEEFCFVPKNQPPTQR